MSFYTRPLLLLAVTTYAASAASGADLEKELRARWQGSWVVIRNEVRSNCDGRFTDVPVLNGRTTGRGSHRLPPGELGRVEKADQQRSRVDLLIELAQPIRSSWLDGPFELFEHRPCRVELEVDVPRDLIKQAAVESISALVESVVEVWDDRAAAASSLIYNARIPEPFPEDYDQTLADYEQWKAETLVIALRALIDDSLEEAAEIVEDVESSEAYSEAFMKGLREYEERLRYVDCGELVEHRFSAQRAKPPSDLSRSESESWEEGWHEAQELAFHIEAASAAKKCLEVPKRSRQAV